MESVGSVTVSILLILPPKMSALNTLRTGEADLRF